MFKMLTDTPVLIIFTKNLLKLPQYPELVHLMCRKKNMVVCNLAGSLQNSKQFQNKLETYWNHRGDHQQSKNSHNIFMKVMSVPFRQPPK